MQKNLHAYIAGLFDGEGTVTLSRNNKSDEFRTVVASMSNTSLVLLKTVQNEFGGSIVNQKTYQPHHKKSWSWKLDRRRAIEFLREILPHMREPEKIRRSKLIIKRYLQVTPRNGKYSKDLKEAKLNFEKEFFAS